MTAEGLLRRAKRSCASITASTPVCVNCSPTCCRKRGVPMHVLSQWALVPFLRKVNCWTTANGAEPDAARPAGDRAGDVAAVVPDGERSRAVPPDDPPAREDDVWWVT